MPVRFGHDGKNILDKRYRHIVVKEIAHGIDEDDARSLPAQRLIERFGMESQAETISILIETHRLEPQRHAFGVAMRAAGTDLIATGERIPGGFSPLDTGARHSSLRSC